MKTIFVISDDSSLSRHVLAFALTIAQKTIANILLGNTCKIDNKREQVLAGGNHKIKGEKKGVTSCDFPDLLPCSEPDFWPEIKEFDISDMDENQVAELINKNLVWMIVKGMPDFKSEAFPTVNLNINCVLNKVLCPVLLIPESWVLKPIERLVYIADLRYCRIPIVKYLAELAKPWKADLLIAHLSAKGLPDIAEKYALKVFREEVYSKVNYKQLLFNNIREKDLTTAVDVMINGMHNDLLVLVNHRFHFEEIIGGYISDTLPAHITIPLLIFPN